MHAILAQPDQAAPVPLPLPYKGNLV